MKNCVGVADLLCAYADNELNDTNRQLVEDHLAICENCSSLLKIYREISISVSESNVPAPESLRIGVMNRVQSESVPRATENSKRRGNYRYILTRYAPVTACLVAVLLVWQFWGNIFGTDSAVAPAAAPDIMPAAAPEAAVFSDDYAAAEADMPTEAAGTFGLDSGIEESEDAHAQNRMSAADDGVDWMQRIYNNIAGLEPLDAEDENLFIEAYAVFAIIGGLPAHLLEYEPTPDWKHEHSGWERLYIIPIPMVAGLEEEVGTQDDVVILFNNSGRTGTYALVLLSYGL